MKILFLSRWFPFPADNGSKIRIHNLLRGLSQHHDVTLLSFYDPNELPLEATKRYEFCSQVHAVEWKPFDAASTKAKLGFFSTTPRSLLDTYSPQMESLIRQCISSQSFDLIIASQLTMASYHPAFGEVPAIFEEVELGLYVYQAFRDGNWVQRLRFMLTWFKLKQYIIGLLDSFQSYTVVSEEERRIFCDNFRDHCDKIEIVPNCVNLEEYQGLDGLPRKYQLIFSGSSRYMPNHEGIQWFLEKVFPLILERDPRVHLIITGARGERPLPDVRNVTFSGHVEDIKSIIASCCISIAPLWSGGGTRLKILEAMALGTPVVSTSKGAEGLFVQHGENILIGDEPQTFAEHVLSLLQDDKLRDRLAINARQLIRDQYDRPAMMPAILGLVERAGM